MLIYALDSASRYLDDVFNISMIYTLNRIYPAELQLNTANASDIEAAFLDLNLSLLIIILNLILLRESAANDNSFNFFLAYASIYKYISKHVMP